MKTLAEVLLEALTRIVELTSEEGINRVLDRPADYDGVYYLLELLDDIDCVARKAIKEVENNNG